MKNILFSLTIVCGIIFCNYVVGKSSSFYSDSLTELSLIKSIDSVLRNKQKHLTISKLVSDIPLTPIDTSYTQHYPGILRSIKFKYSESVTVEVFIKYSKVKYPDSIFQAPLSVTKYSNCFVSCIQLFEIEKLYKSYGVCKNEKYRKK